MPRLRVLVAIPPHPFQPGDVIDVDQVDLPHQRVALGMCEWVDGPPQPEQATRREPAPETTTAGPAETASRRPRRTTTTARRTKADIKAEPKVDPKDEPKRGKDKE